MLDAFPSLAGVVVLAAAVAWLLVSRRYAPVALLWLLIPMAWRVVSSLYIDLAGPVMSVQTLQFVGPGNATSLLAADYAVTVLVFALVLPAKFDFSPLWSSLATRWTQIANLCFALTVLFVIALYVDLVRIGHIPLFAGIERYDYAHSYAGVFHHLLFRFGDVLAVYLGCLLVIPWCLGREPDSRFGYLLLAILVYAFLTGNRYSAFFKFCTLFALPCSLLFAPRAIKKRFQLSGRIFFIAALLTIAAAVIVGVAVFHSYFSVRFEDAELPLDSLRQRVLVQQAEMWWLTYHRVVDSGMWNPAAAFEFLFTNAIDPNRNTSIQYLMYLAIHQDAFKLLAGGQQFAGGFPEIPHEFFGGLGGTVAVAALAVAPALLLRTLLTAVARGRLFTVFWATLVLYPFCIMYWGGMLNFVLAWTFWVKLAGLGVAYLIEQGHFRSLISAARIQAG